MLTRTTDLAARRLGAGFFLPSLFVLRYACMGGLEPSLFASQLRGVRSFKEAAWCGHWNALAQAQLASAGAIWPSFASLLTVPPTVAPPPPSPGPRHGMRWARCFALRCGHWARRWSTG